MESVINKLTEIEAAASGILEGAANQNKVLDQQHSERIAAFDQKLDADTVRRLQNVQSELKNRTDTELLHLRSGTADLLASLDDYYNKNHDTLSTQICEKLIRKGWYERSFILQRTDHKNPRNAKSSAGRQKFP